MNNAQKTMLQGFQHQIQQDLVMFLLSQSREGQYCTYPQLCSSVTERMTISILNDTSHRHQNSQGSACPELTGHTHVSLGPNTRESWPP